MTELKSWRVITKKKNYKATCNGENNMGAMVSASMRSACYSCNSDKLPNPDPKKFEILEVGLNNDFTIVRVKYPDCTNYEGVKILVYKGHVIKEIMAAKEIDPHFCDKHLSPIARFAPTEEGLKLALSLTCNTSILGIIE